MKLIVAKFTSAARMQLMKRRPRSSYRRPGKAASHSTAAAGTTATLHAKLNTASADRESSEGMLTSFFSVKSRPTSAPKVSIWYVKPMTEKSTSPIETSAQPKHASTTRQNEAPSHGSSPAATEAMKTKAGLPALSIDAKDTVRQSAALLPSAKL